MYSLVNIENCIYSCNPYTDQDIEHVHSRDYVGKVIWISDSPRQCAQLPKRACQLLDPGTGFSLPSPLFLAASLCIHSTFPLLIRCTQFSSDWRWLHFPRKGVFISSFPEDCWWLPSFEWSFLTMNRVIRFLHSFQELSKPLLINLPSTVLGHE